LPKDANVFILSGQSNALGQDISGEYLKNLPSDFRGLQDSILVWRNGNYVAIPEIEKFEKMLVSLNSRDKIYNDSLGPYYNITEWGIEQKWLHESKQYLKQKTYLIKSAVGALPISNWNASSDPMYLELKNWILNVEKYFSIDSIPVNFRGLVWMQGEADVSNTNYYSDLKILMYNIRNISPRLKNLPII
jgi:hypothetical protein